MRQVYGPTAARHAAEVSERARRLTGRVVHAPRISLRKPAAVVLVLLGLWLLFGPFILNYPYEVVGQDSELRDAGFSIAVTLSGLLLLATGNRLGSAVAGLCGILLVLSGFLLPHAEQRAMLNEVVTGFLVILATAASLDAAPRPGRRADGPPPRR